MLDDEIRDEYVRLSTIARKCEEGLATAPKGTLRIENKKNGTRYYARTGPQDTAGRYLKADELGLANQLAQKRYDSSVLEAAKVELRALQKLANCRGLELENPRVEPCDGVRKAYVDLNGARRALVEPYDVPDEEYARNWQAEEYAGKAFNYGESSAYFTDRGEKVRSKSEILIANKLFHREIPYHYERPLWLGGRSPIYPDFTVLNVRTRKVYYWEHMGMMGDAEYRNNALRRISAYESSGIFPGDALIITFETEEVTLDMRTVEQVITHYLI